MSTPGWWDVHDLLELGSRGPAVAELQRALNEELSPPEPITGYYGPLTESRVKEFQRRNNLLEDGKVGPITHSVLFVGNYAFSIDGPPKIRQARDTCWAASLESVLGSTWATTGRPRLKVPDLLSRYSRFLTATGAINFAGLSRVNLDLRTFFHHPMPFSLLVEPILAELETNNQHVYLIQEATSPLAFHAVVIFGVRVREGGIFLRIMDPLLGDYTEVGFGVVRDGEAFLLSTHDLSR
jgi:hypothetical protein